jgi:hypothetical protein
MYPILIDLYCTSSRCVENENTKYEHTTKQSTRDNQGETVQYVFTTPREVGKSKDESTAERTKHMG